MALLPLVALCVVSVGSNKIFSSNIFLKKSMATEKSNEVRRVKLEEREENYSQVETGK